MSCQATMRVPDAYSHGPQTYRTKRNVYSQFVPTDVAKRNESRLLSESNKKCLHCTKLKISTPKGCIAKTLARTRAGADERTRLATFCVLDVAFA